MAEHNVTAREGIEERLPPRSIPGVFRRLEIQRELEITDFNWHSDEGTQSGTQDCDMPFVEQQDISQFHPRPWSFQPGVPTAEMSAGEQELLMQLSGNRVYHHPRKMRLNLEHPIPFYATLNEDVLPSVQEAQPMTCIHVEIPVGHPSATYEFQQGATEPELFLANLRYPSEEILAFDAEVTCWHPLPRSGQSTSAAPLDEMDVYITKEKMTVISKLASLTHISDHVAHEALNGKFVTGVMSEPAEAAMGRSIQPFVTTWHEQYLPSFEGSLTLVQTDRSSNQHRHTTNARTFPPAKDVTRPEADDGYCFASFAWTAPGILSDISVMGRNRP
ncbi:hypothetical protein L202_08411 [Cryptococcus amylolentus CBS 6039]|uniref:Uncharacterized protein n=2 Tax=Cryptococcus amylolentus TaxID=104669 RepID=A0A1E3H9L9_9TREE|nr:hypothetical protein L202_08411 [Cryptococcus amylolentus CBS 6039]ODN73013.1 hypothetical protein L202_08411 [Cryptococcus amylolentus CBS 6039]ODN98169.1 hypothetical protein I350_07815 [Cryptococcus amylolentus CBS 6273]